MKKYFFAPLALALATQAGAANLPPHANDMQLMQGAPAPAEKQVTQENFMVNPYNRWSLHHLREIQPTREVYRGDGPVAPLARAPLALDDFTVQLDDRTLTFEPWLREAYTDAVLVMHEGKVVYEKYYGGMQPHEQHQMFSATKSFVGTLALVLANEGKLDLKAKVGKLIPELKNSAFGDATVAQVLDMTTAIQFREEYENPEAEIRQYGEIFRIWDMSSGGPASIYEFLPGLKKKGTHGDAFHYVTPNTDVLGWLIRRATGMDLNQAFEQYFWHKLGMERDGYFWLDKRGNEMAGGGLNLTLRDAARFGQMILDGGRFNGQQVIPESVSRRILQPGDHATFVRYYGDDPWYNHIGYAYHDQWWTFNNPHKAVSAIGVHGQFIYIDPVAKMVVVKQTSDPEAESMRNEVDGPRVYHALAEHLMQRQTEKLATSN